MFDVFTHELWAKQGNTGALLWLCNYYVGPEERETRIYYYNQALSRISTLWEPAYALAFKKQHEPYFFHLLEASQALCRLEPSYRAQRALKELYPSDSDSNKFLMSLLLDEFDHRTEDIFNRALARAHVLGHCAPEQAVEAYQMMLQPLANRDYWILLTRYSFELKEESENEKRAILQKIAFHLAFMGALEGNINASLDLSIMYRSGLGVDKNIKEAIACLRAYSLKSKLPLADRHKCFNLITDYLNSQVLAEDYYATLIALLETLEKNVIIDEFIASVKQAQITDSHASQYTQNMLKEGFEKVKRELDIQKNADVHNSSSSNHTIIHSFVKRINAYVPRPTYPGYQEIGRKYH